jgi:transcriptional regulator NrdR family protein
MICPTCDTYTEVLETRVNPKGVRRRYMCANLHRFTTQEALVPQVKTQAQLRQQLKDETYA